jgi:hypothetical protein
MKIRRFHPILNQQETNELSNLSFPKAMHFKRWSMWHWLSGEICWKRKDMAAAGKNLTMNMLSSDPRQFVFVSPLAIWWDGRYA